MSKYVFGITGGSGAGKSTVSEEFRKRGVYVSDADKAARAVCKAGTECLNEIAREFGAGVITESGELNRRALGKLVFSDKRSLELLNSITHKYIKEYIQRELDGAQSEICAVDGAVIIGSPVMELCSCMVVVTADRESRIKRIMKRDRIDRVCAEDRITSQQDDEFYLSYADYVIENNDDESELGAQIERIYGKIKIEKAAVCP